jgi:hypothetical protein
MAVCIGPAVGYLIRGGGMDTRFWALYGAGSFFLPMVLLAVVTHESLWGLNPLLVGRSILIAFLHYCALVPFFHLLLLPLPVAYSLILSKRYWPLSYLLQAAGFSLVLIAAHLLGRFYWTNRDALDWDV